MSEPRATVRPAVTEGGDAAQVLRLLGARAHQLRATTRAADHYNAQDLQSERDTGSWLISSAVGLAEDLAADIDGLARSAKDRQADAALLARISPLRVLAHQLHAAVKAADHFLDQDSREDQDTGSWLIATANALAVKLPATSDKLMPSDFGYSKWKEAQRAGKTPPTYAKPVAEIVNDLENGYIGIPR